MPFFQIDDQAQANAKVQSLARMAMRDDPQGLAALGLWTVCGSLTQAKLSDGIVSEEDLASVSLNLRMGLELAGHLVRVGLWHGPGHDCNRCPEVAAGTFLFHDWFDLRYKTGDEVRTERRKDRERKSKSTHSQVWQRDCTDDPESAQKAKCAYCGREVNRQDRKSNYQPEIDHIDPTKSGLGNLAIACRSCNRTKGNRSLSDAGMTLTKAARKSDSDQKINGKNQIPDPESAETDQIPELGAVPRGRARIRGGAGSAGLGGAGLGREGKGRDGPGGGPAETPTPRSAGNKHHHQRKRPRKR
ncbi:HNH endonuclease [Arthrobacter rhombi]|uniref:HNH endonuclease n=1 Tax=Arthrobacter rhombi TaxID=71253 RepID=UPI003FCF9A38